MLSTNLGACAGEDNTNTPLWPSVSTATALGPPAETETAKQCHTTISRSEMTNMHIHTDESSHTTFLCCGKINDNTCAPVGGAAHQIVIVQQVFEGKIKYTESSKSAQVTELCQ